MDFIFEILGTVNDKHNKKSHQGIYLTEKRYEGKCRPGVLADYYCRFKRDLPEAIFSQKSLIFNIEYIIFVQDDFCTFVEDIFSNITKTLDVSN